MQSIVEVMEDLLGKVKGLFTGGSESKKLSEFQEKKLRHEYHMFYGEMQLYMLRKLVTFSLINETVINQCERL